MKGFFEVKNLQKQKDGRFIIGVTYLLNGQLFLKEQQFEYIEG